MDFTKKVEFKFFEILKIYNINLSSNRLLEIHSREMNNQILLLKSKKLIQNTEFELLNKLKTLIIELHKYNDQKTYMKIEELTENIINFNDRKSSVNSMNFINKIQYISSSSRESIVNSVEFNSFNEYLHVHRPIENNLREALEDLKSKERGIILLIGSVGDGKSHLLSYFNKNHNSLLKDFYIYNDATESNSPYKTAVETLDETLNKYENNEYKKMIIAINIGMLHNFKEYLKKEKKNNNIIDSIESSDIFSIDGMKSPIFQFNDLTLLSFLNEENFNIENGRVNSMFCENIFEKIFSQTSTNPFYNAYLQDDGDHRTEAAYKNYQLLLNKKVRESIIHLLIKVQIENKRIISTRALLNFIYDIIVPDKFIKENDSFLVNLLFNSFDKSTLLSSISNQDPILKQDTRLDRLNIEIYNSLDLQKKCMNLFGEEDFHNIQNYLYLLEGLNHKRKFEMIVRLHYLFNYEQYEKNSFFDYINLLENVEKDKILKRDILKKVFTAISKWQGSPMADFIYYESLKPATNIRIGLHFKPKPKNISVTKKLTILVSIDIQNKQYEIEVDYNLYLLMKKIENGYILKESDKINSVVFTEFVDNILNNLESTEKTIINIPHTNETYMINEGYLGYEIERLK